MALADYYRTLHDLMIHPEEVGFCTALEQRWATDRYVLVNIGDAGLSPVVQKLADNAAYRLRRTGPPVKVAEPKRDHDRLDDLVTRLVTQWEQQNEWATVAPTEWAAWTGVHHARLLLDPDSQPSYINSMTLAAWQQAMAPRELVLRQPKGRPGMVIRVDVEVAYDTRDEGRQTYERTVGYVMPVGRIGPNLDVVRKVAEAVGA